MGYKYADYFYITSQNYQPVNYPKVPNEFKEMQFTVLLWNQGDVGNLYIKWGEMRIRLATNTSIILDFQDYDTVTTGMYAKIEGADSVYLQIIITGRLIPVKIINLKDLIKNINPNVNPDMDKLKIYVIGFTKMEGQK